MLSKFILQVLSAHFRAYIQALEKLQLDIATSSDLIGVDTRSTSLFLRGREPLKNRSAVYALGERIGILKVFCCYHETQSQKYTHKLIYMGVICSEI